MEDNYANRALFLVMWHGAPSQKLEAKFPKWYHERMKLSPNSIEDAIWIAKFAEKAYENNNSDQNEKR